MGNVTCGRGFVPFPDHRAEEYRSAGYWRGRALASISRRDAATQWPDKPAVIDATGSHTFAELDALADRMAAALAGPWHRAGRPRAPAAAQHPGVRGGGVRAAAGRRGPGLVPARATVRRSRATSPR